VLVNRLMVFPQVGRFSVRGSLLSGMGDWEWFWDVAYKYGR
jgi:hypothetical protein